MMDTLDELFRRDFKNRQRLLLSSAMSITLVGFLSEAAGMRPFQAQAAACAAGVIVFVGQLIHYSGTKFRVTETRTRFSMASPMSASLGILAVIACDVVGRFIVISRPVATVTDGSIRNSEERQAKTRTILRLDHAASRLSEARQSGSKLSADNLSDLQQTILAAADQEQALPQTWRAAAELISYRSAQVDTIGQGAANCYENYTEHGPGPAALQSSPVIYHRTILQNCTLELDNRDSFQSSLAAEGMRTYDAEALAIDPSRPAHNVLILMNVHVIYRGGKVLPFEGIQFINCTFTFMPANSVPPPAGIDLTRELIAADLRDVSVNLAGD